MRDTDEQLLDRVAAAQRGFADVLRRVEPHQWTNPTPCEDWDVRDLARHMVQGNLVYLALLRGGGAEDFMSELEGDSLGDDPLAAFEDTAARCLAAFGEPGVLDRTVDYPFGPVPGRRLTGLLVADHVVHTWDLKRGAKLDERLEDRLVAWVVDNFEWIYQGVAEGPLDGDSGHEYFKAPRGSRPATASKQRLLLWWTGRGRLDVESTPKDS